MSELGKRGLNAFTFKSKYPRLYKHIVKTYGGNKITFDKSATLELWLRGEPAPVCDICGVPVLISSRFKSPSTDPVRCKKHNKLFNILKKEEFVEKVRAAGLDVAGNLPDVFPPTTEINFSCPKHGNYIQLASYFLKGGRCHKCYHEKPKSRIMFDEWLQRSSAAHNNFYDYSKSKFVNLDSEINITCPVHGEFTQNAGVHMRGHGCRQCADDQASQRYRSNTEEFIRDSEVKHAGKYDYSKVVYEHARGHVSIICKKHGEFQQVAYMHRQGYGCPQCGIAATTSKSAAEYEIIEWLNSLGIANVEHSWRGLGKEIDIYLPDYKFAIEYNGIFWHSTDRKEKDKVMSKQHLQKTEMCEAVNIHLVHILDLEWKNPSKHEIWKSVILHKLGLTNNKIYARKCNIVEVSANVSRDFYNANHLQGYASGSVNLGLEYNGQLVALGTFAKARYTKQADYELLRFASLIGTSVVGGFQKVISAFAKTHTGTLVSYANRRWSQGNVYTASGFSLDSVSGPCYYYTDCKTLWHRSVFQKHKLADKLKVFDPAKSEVDNMYANNYRRIWDCGNLVYIKKL